MGKTKIIELKGGVDVPVKHTSSLFDLGWKDTLRALLMAILAPVLFAVQQSIDAGQLDLEWKKLAMVALAGGVSYLIKNFFTPGEVVIDKQVLKAKETGK